MRAGRAVGAMGLMLAGLLGLGALGHATELDAQQMVVRAGDGGSLGVAASSTFSVPINVDMSGAGGQDIASLTFELSWDPSLISYSSSTAGNFGSVVFNEGQTGSGLLTVSVFNPTGRTNDFTAATVEFVMGTTATTSQITPNVTAAGDEQGTDITGLVIGDNLDVCIGSSGLWGDVTGDGNVNIIDAQQVARFSVGLPVTDPQRMVDFGDVTADGNVNIIDAQQIARFSVGLPAAPQTGQPRPGQCTTGQPSIQVSPSSLAFQADLGSDPVPPTQAFTITNTGTATLNWSSVVSASWMSILPASGSLAQGASETVTVTVSSSSLTAAPYDGTIDIIDANASNSPQVVNVSLLVTASNFDLVCGDLLSDAVTAAGQTKSYTLFGNAGDLITLTLVNTSNWSIHAARGRLYAPDGTQVPPTMTANSLTEFTLPVSGTYTVRVSASNLVQTGTFNLGHECILPTSPVDGTLVPGDLLSGSIAAPGQVNLYTFGGGTGDLINLSLVNTTNWSIHAARVQLYAPDGSRVGGALTANSLNEITLPQDGTYILRLYASNLVQTGDFNLGLESILPTNPVDGTLVPGDLLSGSIAAPGQVNLYTFGGSTGDLINLSLVNTTNWSIHAARVQLYAPDGSRVGGTLTANSLNEITLPQDGTYILRLYASNLVQTGDFNLGLESILPTNPVDGTLVPGDLLSGSIAAPGQVNLYTFGGGTGDLINLSLVNTTNWSIHAARVQLYAPDGSRVGGTLTANSLNEITLPQDGTYILRLYASNLVQTGDFNLGLESILPTNPVDGTLVPGDLLSGSIAAPGQVNLYTFGGSTGDLINLSLVNTTNWSIHAARVQLYAPDGSRVGGTLTANSLNEITLPQDGTYILRLYASNLVQTGDFNLGLESILPTNPVDGTLVPGDLLSGSIAAPGQVNLYTFGGGTGDLINLSLVNTTNWSIHAARVQLYAPDGSRVGGTLTANSLNEITLPQDGTYILRLYASNLVQTGDFNLGLESILPTNPVDGTLVPGDLLSGSIAAPGQVNLYTFGGGTGDLINLSLVNTTNWSIHAARVQLYAPDGSRVGGTLTANSLNEITLPQDGTYILRLYASNLVQTGDFNLGLESILPTNPVDGTLTCNGNPFPESIDDLGEVDLLTMPGADGQTVTFTLTNTTNWGIHAARALLYAPDGSRIGGSFTANTQVQRVLVGTGTFIVRMYASNLVATGSYGLTCF